MTNGEFSDSHDGTSSFVASEKFNDNGNNQNSSNPKGNKVYNDVNDNGRYDENVDEEINVNDLASYHDETANVVISSNIDELDPKNDEVTITAEAITSEVDITSDTNSVTLEAESVDLSDTRVSGEDGGVTIRSSGGVNLDGATVTSPTGPVTVKGQSITMREADLSADNGNVSLSADRNGGGDIDAVGAAVESGTGDVSFASGGDVVLDGGDLSAQNGELTATFSGEDPTLSVEETTINDGTGTLYYSPSGVEVAPSEQEDAGYVEPES